MVPSHPPDEHRAGRASHSEVIYLFSVEAIRELDRLAVAEYGLTGAVLMENAARSVAVEVMRLLGQRGSVPRVLICCGPGNNGGDGLALARHLHNEHVDVRIVLAFDPAAARLSEEADMNLHVCERIGLTMIRAASTEAIDEFIDQQGDAPDLIVDALLGTGSTSPPRPPMDRLIEWMNESPATVLSIDVPSGLDAQSGAAPGACVKADVTVALVGVKAGFLELDAQPWIGEIVIGDIGCPRELCERLGERLAAEPVEPGDAHAMRHRSKRGREA